MATMLLEAEAKVKEGIIFHSNLYHTIIHLTYKEHGTSLKEITEANIRRVAEERRKYPFLTTY
jgi:hypothetical protein